MFKKFLSPLACLLVAPLVLVSCFETKQEFTLNPDGSGKVVHESKFQPFNMSLGFGGEEPNEETKMRQAVASILEKSKGVDAWDDVHFERLDDGRILFRGTAWFPDISKLDIKNQMMMKFAWHRGASGIGELTVDLGGEEANDDATDHQAPPEDKAEQEKWLAAERSKYQQGRMMMATMLTGLKHTSLFRLPGEAVSAHHFVDSGDGKLTMEFEGDQFLTAIDAVMADDAWLLANGFSSEAGPELDDDLAEKLFGTPGLPIVTRSALNTHQFDYEAEVSAARANAASLEKILGIDAARVLPPAEGGPLKSAKVVGIRMGVKLDESLDLRPFNHEPGLVLAVLCEFDGAILSIDDQSTMETAVTDQGASILPPSEFHRNIRWAKLSPHKTHALFDVNLEMPPLGTTTLQYLAGTLRYTVSGGTKEQDLGIDKIEKGERGDELGAEITEIELGWEKDGPLNLSLRLNLPKDRLRGAWLVTGDQRHELEHRGYSSSNSITTFTFELPKDYKSDSRIVIEMHDNVRTFTTPLNLRDITLPAIDAP